jgi:hypothetical protein
MFCPRVVQIGASGTKIIKIFGTFLRDIGRGRSVPGARDTQKSSLLEERRAKRLRRFEKMVLGG